MSHGKLSPIFWIVDFERERYSNIGAPRFGGALAMSMSSCMCEPMETAQSLWHGQRGHDSTGYTRSVVQCVGGLRAWPIDMCSKKDAGRSQSETPTRCEWEQARRQILIRQDCHCGSSRVCWQRNILEGKWQQKVATHKKTKQKSRFSTNQTNKTQCVCSSRCLCSNVCCSHMRGVATSE